MNKGLMTLRQASSHDFGFKDEQVTHIGLAVGCAQRAADALEQAVATLTMLPALAARIAKAAEQAAAQGAKTERQLSAMGDALYRIGFRIADLTPVVPSPTQLRRRREAACKARAARVYRQSKKKHGEVSGG